MKFSDYLVKFFEKKNLKHAFGLTGGGAMHLNDSLARSKKIRFIFTHHEQSALWLQKVIIEKLVYQVFSV